ncbi:unnamed protein product [Gordionus sp. m RMFG-2023]
MQNLEMLKISNEETLGFIIDEKLDMNLNKKIPVFNKLIQNPLNTGGKIQLKTAKGTRDYDPFQMSIRKKVLNVVASCFERYGAESIDTPIFELRETLTGKYGEDGGKLIYNLEDQGGELLSLRYDLTVPFARFIAMNAKHLKTGSGFFKRYHIGKVYRRDNPSFTKGRLREFYQCDFDIACLNVQEISKSAVKSPIAADSTLPEVECLRLVYELCKDLGLFGLPEDLAQSSINDLQTGAKLIIKVNHRQLLENLLRLACDLPAHKFQTTCSSIDKLDKSPWEEIRKELIEIKEIDPAIVDKMKHYLEMKGREELVEQLFLVPQLNCCQSSQRALQELDQLMKYCQLYDISSHVIIDLSLARGLDYYTGLIFEAVLSGSNSVGEVGSIAGGGRYDDLVGLLDSKHKKVPCIGFSLGLERIFAILERTIKDQKLKIRTKATDVYVMSAQKNLLPERVKLCIELWNAGINAEHPMKENSKILSQFQFCEDYNIPLAVIIGETELKEGIVTLRDILSRTEISVPRYKMIDEIKIRLNLPSNYRKPVLKF